ncbi:hypothetical protein CEXT_169421 [Caerostris extrusa]|uniref:Uncharacterized protein n=1 Tax=Caerostris extrusa TaxID=172846 RepID=A0AAV4M7H4_CAEEX|nr:hypothetical protein CEXT_169421 [Caerostris extrusa]
MVCTETRLDLQSGKDHNAERFPLEWGGAFRLNNCYLNLIGKLRHFLHTIWKNEFKNGLHQDKIRSAVREGRRHHNGALCRMIENQLFSILSAPLHCRNGLPFSQSVIPHNA